MQTRKDVCMFYDLKSALSYMFKGKTWVIPFFIGIVLTLPPILIKNFMTRIDFNTIDPSVYNLYVFLSIVVIFVLSLFCNGYVLRVTNSRVTKREEPLLQWNNLGEILKIGLKNFAGGFIYSIPLDIAMIILWMRHIYLMFNSNNVDNFFVAGNTIILILVCLLHVMITVLFATDLRFRTFFNFKLLGRLLKNNFKGFLVLLLLLALMIVIVGSLSRLLHYNLYAVGVLIAVLSFYLSLVKGDLIAQFIKNTNTSKEEE